MTSSSRSSGWERPRWTSWKWHVVVGDHVAVGDELVQVESEKITITTALEAAAAGVVVELLARPGDTVDVGSSICRIDPGR
jgi:pyruvate/2-oxoglutarate dehydrogenase complex dihydrolipoamide acyltransferase (E2) component